MSTSTANLLKKRNRVILDIDVKNLPTSPQKRLKTPTNEEEHPHFKMSIIPPAARDLSLDGHITDDKTWNMPPEIESPRLNTPEGWSMFCELALLDNMFSQRSESNPMMRMETNRSDATHLSMMSTRSTPMANRTPLAKMPMGNTLRTPMNLKSSSARGTPTPAVPPLGERGSPVLNSFKSREEAKAFQAQLAAELNATSPTNGTRNSPDENTPRKPPLKQSTRTFLVTPTISPHSTRSSTPTSTRKYGGELFRFPSPTFDKDGQLCIPAGGSSRNIGRGRLGSDGSDKDHFVTPTPRKRKLCRHFLKGFCKQGDACGFLHDASIFSPDSHKVFLGGLPANLTSEGLVQELERNGYKIMNRPQVLRGFSPKVCMENERVVSKLVKMQKLRLWGNHVVDVRPYKDKKPLSEGRRSVFLGGLADFTSVTDIKVALERVGASLRNSPVLKSGFAPQVIVGSAEEAQRLVQIKQIECKGKMIDVRPFVDLRPRKRNSGHAVKHR